MISVRKLNIARPAYPQVARLLARATQFERTTTRFSPTWGLARRRPLLLLRLRAARGVVFAFGEREVRH
jgi:hypothetical protein